MTAMPRPSVTSRCPQPSRATLQNVKEGRRRGFHRCLTRRFESSVDTGVVAYARLQKWKGYSAKLLLSVKKHLLPVVIIAFLRLFSVAREGVVGANFLDNPSVLFVICLSSPLSALLLSRSILAHSLSLPRPFLSLLSFFPQHPLLRLLGPPPPHTCA